MTTQPQLLTGARPSAQATSIFRRVLVGVDPSPESREAVRQGAVLVDPAGALTLLAVWTLPPPIVGAELPPASLEEEPSRRGSVHVEKCTVWNRGGSTCVECSFS